MRNLIFISTIVICILNTSTAQIAGNRLPEKYIARMKIKKLTEFVIEATDTVYTVTYFYKDGKISQRTKYYSKSDHEYIGIDSGYNKSKVAYYESFIYDEKGRIHFTASSWTGLSEPYILTSEYLYSNDGDTTFMKSYSKDHGQCPIWTSPHLNIRDSAMINEHCSAFFTRNNDTVYYKFQYRNNNKDSLLFSRDLARTNYHFEVYQNGLLSNFGIVSYLSEDSKNLLYQHRILFDNIGMPYKSINYWQSDKKEFVSEIEIETY